MICYLGLGGNNVVDGGAGADARAGRYRQTPYVVNDGKDNVIENSNRGIDTVKSPVSHTLSANVENLVLIGTPQSTVPAMGSATRPAMAPPIFSMG